MSEQFRPPAMTRAIRGATTVANNDAEDIVSGTAELVTEIMRANRLRPEDMVSVIFTVTPDLNAAFPAVGARRVGLSGVPLICTTEIPVPGSLQKCIRCLMHINTTMPAAEIRHIYLHGARVLRPDLVSRSNEAAESGTSTGSTASAAFTASAASAGSASLPPFSSLPYRATIERITPYVPGKAIAEVQKELGLTDVIKLASNENPLGPSPAAVKAVVEAATTLHRYPDGGAVALREALSRQYRLSPDCVFAGNGSDEIIKLLAEAMLNPGEEVIMADVTFSEYAYAARLMGAEEVVVPLRAGTFDLEAMAERVTPKTRLIFVCNPNNPTGTYVGREAVERFLDRLPAHALPVFDEAYAEYSTAADFPDIPALIREGRRLVSLRTFSKIYGLAGLRVGYALACPEVTALLNRVKEPFNVNSAAQAAALAALSDSAHVQRSIKVNEDGKRQLYQGLDRLKLPYYPTQANFVCVDVGRPCRPVYERMLREGVIVRTLDGFGLPQALRITIGTREDNERCLLALARALTAR